MLALHSTEVQAGKPQQPPYYSKSCPNVNIVENFDLERFLGRWFEVFRDHWAPHKYRECVTSKWYIRYDGKVAMKVSQTDRLHFNENK